MVVSPGVMHQGFFQWSLFMPRYIVLDRSWINNRMYQPGDEVEYDGEAGENLELIDVPAPKSKKAPAVVEDDPPL